MDPVEETSERSEEAVPRLTVAERKADAERRMAEIEETLDDALMAMLVAFMSDVLADALDALDAPVVIASGRVRDPFAWTSVRARWYDSVRALAAEADGITDARIIDLLMQSDLPYTAYLDVSETLATSVSEGWTVHKTKRELSRRLITKRGKGEDLSPYRNRIRSMARTAATLNFNAEELSALVEQGYQEKEWVTQHDSRVRSSHVAADGQVVPVLSPFIVGGYPMQVPGDPVAPLSETINCRCYVIGVGKVDPPKAEPDPALPDDEVSDAYDYRDDLDILSPSPYSVEASGGTVTRPNLRAVPVPSGTAFTSLTAADSAPVDAAPPRPTWAGVIGTEGVLTGDGRLIERDALRWDLPAPIRYVRADVGAHDGAEVVGRILTIERRENGDLWATGDFDPISDVGMEAIRVVGEDLVNGVSMDLDDVTFEVRIAADVLDAMVEPLSEDEPVVEPERKTDEDGRVVVATVKPDDEVYVTTDGRVRAATIVAIPAFANARISLTDEPGTPIEDAPVETVTASGAPVAPPAKWFDDPALAGPTALVVEESGRVYGHIALWGTCHTSHTADGACIQPPSSATGYAHFRTGSLLTAEGTEVPVGHLTLDTKHAGPRLSAEAAAMHYDRTGSVAADVAAGEDAFGIWVAGALRPDLSDADVRALRAAPISGDWRRIGGNLELVAALAVNVPGFPVPRPQGLVASGTVYSLTASGMVAPGTETSEEDGTTVDEGALTASGLSAEDVRYLRALADRERAAEAKDLAERVGAATARVRVAAFAAALRGKKG